jgi:hypothetical protein
MHKYYGKLLPSLSHSPSFSIPTLSVDQDPTRPTALVSSINKEDKDKEENFNISTPIFPRLRTSSLRSLLCQ